MAPYRLLRVRRRTKEHFVAAPHCIVCNRRASYVELAPPGYAPLAGGRASVARAAHPDAWWLVFKSIESGNGYGAPISPEEAQRLALAFSEPITFAKVASARLYDDAGFCAECEQPYCYEPWNVDRGAFGRCPKGHGRSLDPNWSPEDYE
jgi:hypothetical protein